MWAFTATLAADFAWTLYIAAVARDSHIGAACWSAIIVALGGIVTLKIVHNRWNLLWAMFGAFIGTWLGMLVP